MKKFFVELFTPILDVLKSICFFFDNIIYGFIPNLYKLMMYLANVNLTNNDTIKALTSRVYILVGIFMLFKLSFSILRYVIDPNSFTDQGKGIGNLVKRVLISLILLVSIPFIFDKAYDLQRIVIKSNIIPRMILGTDTGSDVTDSLDSSATDVQFLLFGPFFSVNYAIEDLAACEPSNDRPMANILGTADMARATKNIDGSTTECLTQFNDALLNSNLKNADVNLKDFFRYGANGTDERDFSQLGALISWSIDSQKVIIYQPVISTLVGVYLVFLLLSFCIDVAARAIRLSFYQMLSPVAVISYMDPSEGTQGGKLKEWATECLRVFASIFLRLAVMFLIVQVVKIISEALSVSDGSLYYDESLAADAKSMNKYVYLFLVLGAFQAASKLPEIIEKAFGFKFSGELNLNPFKALSSNAGFMGVTGAATGLAAGIGAGALAGYTTSKDLGRSTRRSLLSGAGGAITGALGGTVGGFRTKGIKGFSSGSKVGGRISRRMEVREATGGNVAAMALERVRRTTGMQTEYETLENRAKRFDEVRDGVSKMRTHIVGELGKGKDDRGLEWLSIQASRKQVDADLEKGILTPPEYASWQQKFTDMENKLIASYNDDSASGDKADADLEALRVSEEKARKDAKMQGSTGSWSDLQDLKSTANAKALEIRTSENYNDARDRSEAIKLTEHDAFFGGGRGK